MVRPIQDASGGVGESTPVEEGAEAVAAALAGIGEGDAADDAPTVLSPFLPGTNIQFAYDSTSLGYLKTCPRLYQYIMIDGWAPKDDSIHLFFGQLFHTAMQEYEILRCSGVDHEGALREVVKGALIATWIEGVPWEVDPTTKAGKYKNRFTLIHAIIHFLDKYNGEQDDPAKTVVMEDGRPAVELSFRFELDWGPLRDEKIADVLDEDGNKVGEGHKLVEQPYLLCGHLDRVVTFNDQTFVMDYKTTTTTPSDYYFDQFSPNNQMTLYTIAGGVVLDTQIKGVIIAAHQILLEKEDKSIRGFTFRTQGQLDEWLRDLEWWFNQAEAYAEAGYWPMNDTSCDKFGGCKFRGICSKDPEVRDRFLAADFVKLAPEDRWNPLKPR